MSDKNKDALKIIKKLKNDLWGTICLLMVNKNMNEYRIENREGNLFYEISTKIEGCNININIEFWGEITSIKSINNKKFNNIVIRNKK